MDTVDVVGKMARIQDLNGNVVQTKELVKDKSALHVLFSPDSIDSRGDLKEEGKQAMQELVEMHDLTNPKKLGEFLVQLHIAQIEHFNERFELLEDLHLNDYSSRLMDGKTYLERYKRAQDETNQVSYLEKADDAFIKAIHRFEGALRIYVSDVKKIVRGPRFIRSIKLTKLDGDMKKSGVCLRLCRNLLRWKVWSDAGKKTHRMTFRESIEISLTMRSARIFHFCRITARMRTMCSGKTLKRMAEPFF